MKRWLFIGIVVLSVVLRFFQLGKVPVSPDWDEAALGYNAYSILTTGRDEYGIFLPRTLRSFDDYKPPLYAYLAIPPVAVFGLNTWAVRLPSAVFGVLAVIGTYYLVLELFRTKQSLFPKPQLRKKNLAANHIPDSGYPQKIALVSAFLLAISPWHLQFSRIAFEANTGVTLNIWGLVAFFRGLTSYRWMVASAFLFGVSLYAYHSERVFVPLMVIVLSVLWRKSLFSDPRKVMVAALVGIVTVLPLLPVVLDKTSITRLKGTSRLSDQTGLLMRSVGKLDDDRKRGRWSGALFDNRRIVYAKTLIDGYISHFSLRWLFLTGDNDRHHAPDTGLMYLWELPFLLAGIYLVWRMNRPISAFLMAWLLVAPLAASPTSETPHAIRTLVALPLLQIFTAVGIEKITRISSSLVSQKQLLTNIILKSSIPLIVLFMAGNTVSYFHLYYAHMNREYSMFWQYGYEQAVQYAEARKDKYEKIVVSTSLEQPHMFFLFYTRYDPNLYLSEGGTSSGGFAEIKNRFGKYEFRPIPDWGSEVHDGSVLYIGSPKELPSNAYVISYLNGQDAIRISE